MTPEQARPPVRALLLRCFVPVAAALSFVPATLPGDDGRATRGSGLRARADEIRSSANDLFKLRRIPWVTDPAEGFRLAQEENRPVFFYMQAGDPLEDC